MKLKIPCIVCVILLTLALCASDVTAQRYHSNRGNGRYNNYYSYNYRPSRPYVSVNIGRYNNYRQPYYRPVYRSSGYVHFGPSFGVRINILPLGYYPFYIGSNPYYYNDGVYYRPYNGGGYEVTGAPLGATVKRLPSGSKVTVIDGQKYYELGGTYYQEEINEKNQLRYKVVGTDGVLNTTEETVTIENSPAASTKTMVKTNVIPETGARFDVLPEGSKTVVIKKEKYYLSPAGVYYQEVIDGDNIRYEVTGNSASE
jgi:hypothetical protein